MARDLQNNPRRHEEVPAREVSLGAALIQGFPLNLLGTDIWFTAHHQKLP
jgi:hypothetical protein